MNYPWLTGNNGSNFLNDIRKIYPTDNDNYQYEILQVSQTEVKYHGQYN